VPEPVRASLFGHTANLYLSVWTNVFDPDALDRAIDLCRMAEELQPGGVLEPLTAALVSRYKSRATAADLDEAITRLEAVIPGDAVSPSDQSSALLATTLANALRHRAILTGDRRDIDRAVALYEALAGIETTEEFRKQIRRLFPLRALTTARARRSCWFGNQLFPSVWKYAILTRD